MRWPILDSYFAISANLGTHTFFMVALPILCWCGCPAYGKALIQLMSGGVFFTGMIKDFLSLPRPMSPPLQRINMSESAALEYGFPSTHSANAASVAIYCFLLLCQSGNSLSLTVRLALGGLVCLYLVTIVVGRLYCGMHGFLDVSAGFALGATLAYIVFNYGPAFDAYMYSCSWLAPFVVAVVVVFLVRIHPEPADDCPCFDDSVAVAGVVIGLEAATWSHGRISLDPFDGAVYSAVPPNVLALSVPVIVTRIVVGVLVIFAWRGTMKPLLLRILPYAFRRIENAGLIRRPRRFFQSASDYAFVPPKTRIDNVFPAVSDLPQFVKSIRHPTRRGRTVSIGPQSAADAYETLAYRERKRRESIGSASSTASTCVSDDIPKVSQALDASGSQVANGDNGMTKLRRPEALAGEEQVVFSGLTKGRARYDVEVVTKLVVYTGIAWLANQGVPILFELIGLGTNGSRGQTS